MTGKGNIVASRKHATQVSESAIEAYLGVSEEGTNRDAALDAIESSAGAGAAETVSDVLASLGDAKAPSAEQVEALKSRIAARQKEVGFQDYKSWKESAGEPC